MVKPEPLDSLTAGPKSKISSGVRPRVPAAVLGGSRARGTCGGPPFGPFAPKPGGFLSVSCGSGVRVRRGIVVGRSGTPVIDSSPAATPDGLDRILVGASGEGILLVADPGRVPWLKALCGRDTLGSSRAAPRVRKRARVPRRRDAGRG